MKVKFDWESNALYIRFSDAPISESEEVRENVILDFDAEGHVVGLEVLNFTEQFGWREEREVQLEVLLKLAK